MGRRLGKKLYQSRKIRRAKKFDVEQMKVTTSFCLPAVQIAWLRNMASENNMSVSSFLASCVDGLMTGAAEHQARYEESLRLQKEEANAGLSREEIQNIARG